MKALLIGIIASTFLTAMSIQNNPPGYRGIVPLKSTRADVERVFGPPTDPRAPTYFFSDKTVRIQYSKHGCTPPPHVEGWPVPPLEGWNVPPDTVLVVRVTMRKQVSLDSLKLDLTRFTKERGDKDVPSHFRYVDRESGLTIDLNGGAERPIVRAFIYEPESKYNNLRCGEQKTQGDAL